MRRIWRRSWNLGEAVEKYYKYKAANMEEISCIYGYPIDKWDVSHVQDMSSLFEYMGTFNEYIGSWDVSNVTDMTKMFCCAYSFNQDIGSWDVSNVTDMEYMFVMHLISIKILGLGMYPA
jgi:surface protein